MSDDTISAGFAVDLYPEDVIDANVEDTFSPKYGKVSASERREAIEEGVITKDGELTPKGWEWLNDDIRKVEVRVVSWLRDTFEGARDEGHGGHSGEELIGTFWVNPRSKKQMGLLEDMASGEGIELETIDVWSGLSKLSNALGGRLFAFDVEKPTTYAERARKRR
jgi:hypothetical protein